MVKKADIILFICIILCALILGFGLFYANREEGEILVIKVDNKEYMRLPLDKDETIKLEKNTVIIKDGFAYMESAECPDKVCVNEGKISKKGQTVICLPQRVVLEVE